MKRVAEIMHICDAEREQFLTGALNLTDEEKKVLWLCGVRKQQYFGLNDLIFMTFEYEGKDFAGDMEKMAAYLDTKGLLIKKRRKDVPIEERPYTSWWAPVKKLGELLEDSPSKSAIEEWDVETLGMISGSSKNYDISYSDDDWTESMHF